MQTRVFGRTKAHREALLRNLSRSLVLSETITTTEPRAKEVRRIVDTWITLAKRTNEAKPEKRLSLYRRLLTLTGNTETAKKLVADLALRSSTRISGFVSLARVQPRVGDAAKQQQLRLVDGPLKVAKTEKQQPVAAKTSKGTSK